MGRCQVKRSYASQQSAQQAKKKRKYCSYSERKEQQQSESQEEVEKSVEATPSAASGGSGSGADEERMAEMRKIYQQRVSNPYDGANGSRDFLLYAYATKRNYSGLRDYEQKFVDSVLPTLESVLDRMDLIACYDNHLPKAGCTCCVQLLAQTIVVFWLSDSKRLLATAKRVIRNFRPSLKAHRLALTAFIALPPLEDGKSLLTSIAGLSKAQRSQMLGK